MNPRWRLLLAALLFIGWIGFLGYAAVTKNRAPIVSHIQSAAASAAVVAELTADPEGKPSPRATVVEKLWGNAPDGAMEVANAGDARGFTGPGKYLLYLAPSPGGWLIVGQQRSPGNELNGFGPPLIYPWSDAVREQVKQLEPKP